MWILTAILRRPLLLGMIGCALYSGQMIALGTTTELRRLRIGSARRQLQCHCVRRWLT